MMEGTHFMKITEVAAEMRDSSHVDLMSAGVPGFYTNQGSWVFLI